MYCIAVIKSDSTSVNVDRADKRFVYRQMSKKALLLTLLSQICVTIERL